MDIKILRGYKHSSISIMIFIFSHSSFAGEQIPSNVTQGIGKNVEFESDFLQQDNLNKIDLHRFASGSSALPGNYLVDVIINNINITHESVEFKATADSSVYPCLTPKLIELINFKTESLPDAVNKALISNQQCINLQSLIPEAKVEFDSGSQILSIELPQIYVTHKARGTVSPELWDSGIPAFTFGYYLNTYDSQYADQKSSSVFASLNTGLNIGSWYLRHNGSYNWQDANVGEYTALNTYVQRDVAALHGQLIIGQSNTNGQLFNTLPFSGVQLSSDERMLPDSQRGYAPQIRGIAKTNAKVTVKQQGQIIYETTVTPGVFLIEDLYPTGYGGDLDVTITESDGSQSNYTMPYASVAQLLRPGAHKYSLTIGRLHDDSVSDNPELLEATYQRGLTNIFTGYGGVQADKNYQAIQLGTAIGNNLGALSVDATQSSSHLGANGGILTGQSYRASYSKLIDETNSNITLAAYRFSSSGYMDYMMAMQTRQALKEGNDPNNIWRSKNRFAVSLSQGLVDGWGNLYLSALTESYWNSTEINTQYQMGYSNNFKRVSYSVNASHDKSSMGKSQTSYYLNVSIPLWSSDGTNVPTLSMHYTQDSEGSKSEQAMLSGTLGERNKYSYNISASNDRSAGNSGNISGSWQGTVASVNGGYSTGKNYHSTSFGMSGMLIAHSGGITFSSYTGDTLALIEAKGAEGSKIGTYAGAQIDSFGYAIFPSLTPYQFNNVAIDPEGSSQNIEFENTSQKIVPRAGAVVKVKFTTHSGTPLLITSSIDGEPIPFGAEIFDEVNNYVGAVSQGGVMYARVNETKGKLLVKWGDDLASRCQVGYFLAPVPADKVMSNIPQRFNTPCQRQNLSELPNSVPEAAITLNQ